MATAWNADWVAASVAWSDEGGVMLAALVTGSGGRGGGRIGTTPLGGAKSGFSSAERSSDSEVAEAELSLSAGEDASSGAVEIPS